MSCSAYPDCHLERRVNGEASRDGCVGTRWCMVSHGRCYGTDHLIEAQYLHLLVSITSADTKAKFFWRCVQIVGT